MAKFSFSLSLDSSGRLLFSNSASTDQPRYSPVMPIGLDGQPVASGDSRGIKGYAPAWLDVDSEGNIVLAGSGGVAVRKSRYFPLDDNGRLKSSGPVVVPPPPRKTWDQQNIKWEQANIKWEDA